MSSDITLSGPEIVDGMVHFSQADLLRYELAQERVRSTLREVEILKLKEQVLTLEYEQTKSRLLVVTQEKISEATDASKSLRSLQEQIEDAYNVQVRSLIYDTVTGRLSIGDSPIRAE